MGTELEKSKAPGAAALEPVLDEFARLVRRSTTAGDACAPYLYREKTLVGVLGAAAWSIGGSALWELTTDKGRGHTRRTGRADLVLWTPSRRSFVFEAKRDEVVLDEEFDEYDAKRGTERLLAEACRDARSTPRGLAEHRAGLAFIVPVFPLARAGRASMERFLDGSAWCSFDVRCWAPCRAPVRDEDAGVVLPGVLLLARFC